MRRAAARMAASARRCAAPPRAARGAYGRSWLRRRRSCRARAARAAATGSSIVAVTPPSRILREQEAGAAAVQRRQAARGRWRVPTPGARAFGQAGAGVDRPARAACRRDARARMRTSPPSGSGVSPCRIAFSTSVTSIIGGNGSALQRSGTSVRMRQARAHADLLHRQVREGERQLVAERRVGCAHARQHRAEVARQVLEHRVRGGRIGLEQPPHVGERVEQEVRLDLRLHHEQPRLGQLARRAARGACPRRAGARPLPPRG